MWARHDTDSHDSSLNSDGIENSHENACRLRLSTTISTLFFRYGRFERTSYSLLGEKLKKAINAARRNGLERELMFLWLLFIGGISVFKADEDRVWLHHCIKTSALVLNVHNWPTARGEIKNFPWIDKAHDQAGQELWQAVFMD
jgi:hypothetical protein